MKNLPFTQNIFFCLIEIQSFSDILQLAVGYYEFDGFF